MDRIQQTEPYRSGPGSRQAKPSNLCLRQFGELWPTVSRTGQLSELTETKLGVFAGSQNSDMAT